MQLSPCDLLRMLKSFNSGKIATVKAHPLDRGFKNELEVSYSAKVAASVL
jgi:hypothetical protein